MSTGFIPPTPQRPPEQSAGPRAGSSPVLELSMPEQKSDVDSNLSFDVQQLAFDQLAVIGAGLRVRIMRVPAMQITDSDLIAITIPSDADHRRSEATLGCSYHADRKSTRLNSQSPCNLVCRLLLE